MTFSNPRNPLQRPADLYKMLYAWAARYTCNHHLREQLVDATILTLTHDPDVIDERHIRRSVLKVLARIAREEFGGTNWRKGPFDIEMYPDGERYVVRLSKGSNIERMRFINERCAVNYLKTLRQRSLIRTEVWRGSRGEREK